VLDVAVEPRRQQVGDIDRILALEMKWSAPSSAKKLLGRSAAS
jgi:hypothetical protein